MTLKELEEYSAIANGEICDKRKGVNNENIYKSAYEGLFKF